jgi:glycosyltransferase involved in cell wall biosynthesis
MAAKKAGATRLVLRFSNTLSGDLKKRSLTRPLKIAMMRRLVKRVSALIAVSGDVAGDVAKNLKIGREQLHVLPNPVIDTNVNTSAGRNPDHPWLRHGQAPVVLGVGRLHAQKDFATLIKAFARLCNKQDARLIIYGEGDERSNLQYIASESGHSEVIDLPGHHPCPWREMRHADLLVLSSRWEGMPGVLIEAMAAGCPVISTDCPGGSREILQDGALGPLVPVGDSQAMAEAMLTMLDSPVDRQALQAAASRYAVQEAARAYLALFERTVGSNKHNNQP